MKLIEKHDLHEEIAIRVLGWKWMSFVGIPTKSAEGYPAKRRVRELFSPKMLKSAEWQKYLAENEGREADMTEPLSYCYCSSQGPVVPPRIYLLVQEWGE